MSYDSQETFYDSLRDFLQQREIVLPSLEKLHINLYDLYRAVTKRGGVEAVIVQRLWRDIATELNIEKEDTNAIYNLRITYLKYLYAFEQSHQTKTQPEFVVQQSTPQRSTQHHNTSKAIKQSVVASPPSVAPSTTVASNIVLPFPATPVPPPPSAPSNTITSTVSTPPTTKPTVTTTASMPVPPKSTPLTRTSSARHAAAAKTPTQPAESEKPAALVFRTGSYIKTAIPPTSQRLLQTDNYFQKRVVQALDSGKENELEWATRMLVIKSYETDFIIKAATNLLDKLLSLFDKYWESYLRGVQSDDNYKQKFFQSSEFIYINRTIVILRNISFVEENERYLAISPKFFNFLQKVIYSKDVDPQLSIHALETLANIAQHFTLHDGNIRLVEYLLELFQSSNEVEVLAVILDVFAKLSRGQLNQQFWAKLDVGVFQRIEDMWYICSGEPLQQKVRDSSLTLLLNLANYGTMKTRHQIAQQTSCIKFLMGLLTTEEHSDVNSAQQQSTTIQEKVANILLCLAVEPKNRPLFLPYEEQLIHLSLTTPAMSKYFNELIVMLSEYETH